MMKRTLVALVALTAAAIAQTNGPVQFPLQIGICPGLQLMPEDTDIVGLRLDLPYSYNQLVRGFDLGVACVAERFEGIQLGIFANTQDSGKGLSCALIHTAQDCEGVQGGLMCFVEGELVGVQTGIVNVASEVTGVQIGLFNHCESLRGVQIGLANIALDAPLPFCVLVNASF